VEEKKLAREHGRTSPTGQSDQGNERGKSPGGRGGRAAQSLSKWGVKEKNLTFLGYLAKSGLTYNPNASSLSLSHTTSWDKSRKKKKWLGQKTGKGAPRRQKKAKR